MDAIALQLGKLGALEMPKPTKKGETQSKSERRKHSFDSEGTINEILELMEAYRLKGKFINLCIQIAAREAFEMMKSELSNVEKLLGQLHDPDKKEDK
jgi:hypothetical protein